jgi:hypothetical protein
MGTQHKKHAVLREREQNLRSGKSHSNLLATPQHCRLVAHKSCRHIVSNIAIRDATRKSHAVLPIHPTIDMDYRRIRPSRRLHERPERLACTATIMPLPHPRRRSVNRYKAKACRTVVGAMSATAHVGRCRARTASLERRG